jgi:Domain of unknown function (DUF222)/HNH endonuclease
MLYTHTAFKEPAMPPIEDQITELWGHITAATYRFLELVAEFDRSKRWADIGMYNCAHWLNIYCGIGHVAAREKVRVAHAIEALPRIREAFREGRISYSKVRAMTRVATAENEDVLLNIAIHGTASHVERTVRYYRQVERLEDAQRAAATHRDRYLTMQYEDDAFVIKARLPAEAGALVQQAIERAMEMIESDPSAGDEAARGGHPIGADPDDPVSAETIAELQCAVPEDVYPFAARRADALIRLAGCFMTSAANGTPASSDPWQVVVHIDHALLGGVEPEAEGRPVLCELEDGTPLAVETARRLACDSALVGIVDDDDGEPLNVGRKTRAISPALRRALKARDRGCRFPGCTHTRFTQGHHVEHWANGGETKLSNLITLCHFHHHLVHEGGFGVERTDDGLYVFTKPDGDALPEFVAVENCGSSGFCVGDFVSIDLLKAL